MIRGPEEQQGDLSLRADVVIVGTGPGGASAAAKLSEAGLKVVLLEAGKRFLPHQLTHRMVWAHENLFQEKGTRVAQGKAFIPVFSAEVVGGGTFVNSAICFRAPDEKLNEWVRDFGLDFATPEAMRPYFEQVERDIVVAKTTPAIARGNNLIFKKGVEALGLSGDFISRNAPGCIGCGVCRMGCPIAGKGSTDMNYLRRAAEKGAEIYTQARVEKVLVEKGRAFGVEGSFGSARLRVEASHVLLSGGAFGTAKILMQSRLGDQGGQLGNNLRLHPSTGTFALFEEEIRFWDGVTQGYYHHDVENRTLLETFSESPEIPFAAFPRASLSPKQMRHIAASGAMLGDRSGGSVNINGGVKYELDDEDRRSLVRSLRLTARIFFAAGAREVFPGVHGSTPQQSLDAVLSALPDELPVTSLSLQSSHPHGTARMAADPKKGVVRPDGRVHGVEQLWVADGSLFPTALGVNPQITIMAFAKVIAERLLGS